MDISSLPVQELAVVGKQNFALDAGLTTGRARIAQHQSDPVGLFGHKRDPQLM
jgi:hypothetical protein